MTHQCNHEHSCIHLVPIFNHLEDAQMSEIMNGVQSFSYQKDETIYMEGDTSKALFIVNSGKIRIYRLSESGKEQLIRILNPGDYTGELALFNETRHESYAQAMVDTDVCVISKELLESFLMKYPAISLRFLSEFSKRLETSEKQTARFTNERVETRLAMFLSECVNETQSPIEIKLPMSKKDLASYIGTTPETLSRKLGELEERGLIKQKPKKVIEILDIEKLLTV